MRATSGILLSIASIALSIQCGYAIKACMSAAAPGAIVRAPGDADYSFAASRGLYPEPKPGFLVEAASKEEVSAALTCAAGAGLGVCARTGGHSFIGLSACSGVMVDLARMKGFSYGAGQISVEAGNTLGEMFYKTRQASADSQLVGIGLCPSVGIAGYLLGGGFNPYSGLLGLTCESMERADFVMPDGSFLSASKTENAELFWASCGGGGGALGIMYNAVLNTHDSTKYDANTYFRYKWPGSSAGELLNKFMNFEHENGNVWVRLEVRLDEGIVAYGVCWDETSVAGCESRLGQGTFFNVAGREAVITKVAADVSEFQKFIGPAGDWATKIPTISDEAALVGTNYDEAELGLKRVYTSSFLRFKESTPSAQVFQQLADVMYGIDQSKIDFMLAQFNPWTGAHKENAGTYAFAHREADTLMELIGGKNSATGQAVTEALAELNRVQKAMVEIVAQWRYGIYVNYPEFIDDKEEYEYMYWGPNLQRLATLRAELDPSGVLNQKQILPSGDLECRGSVEETVEGTRRSFKIVGAPNGQLTGMKVDLQVSAGCTLGSAQGGTMQEKSTGVYEVSVDGQQAFSVLPSMASCTIRASAINGITCGSGTGPTQAPGNSLVATEVPVTTSAGATCTPLGQRCAGAPGQPLVPWLGCCAGECVEDAQLGWGRWCK